MSKEHSGYLKEMRSMSSDECAVLFGWCVCRLYYEGKAGSEANTTQALKVHHTWCLFYV